MRRVWFILLIFCILQACQQEVKEETSTQPPPDSISTPAPTAIEADTAQLHYLDSLYEHNLTVVTPLDSESYDPSYHYVPQKFDFTGDGVMDFLVLSSYDYRFIMGHIVDGVTGKELNEWDPHYGVLGMDSTMPLALIFNRPDHDKIETRIVDVNCQDNQKELLVISDNAFIQMGGPASFCTMFRYDQPTQSIKLIFEHTIEYRPVGPNPDGSMREDEANYLDILYEDKPCLDSIWVRDAYVLTDTSMYEGALDYKLIRPGSGESKLYRFNNQENAFEEVGKKELN